MKNKFPYKISMDDFVVKEVDMFRVCIPCGKSFIDFEERNVCEKCEKIITEKAAEMGVTFEDYVNGLILARELRRNK